MVTKIPGSSSRLLRLWAAGLVVALAMLSHALVAAPRALAYCYPVAADDREFVHLMAEEGIGPKPGYTWCDIALIGHHIAEDIRAGVSPVSEALNIYYQTDMTTHQAATEVVDAIYIFAPDQIYKLPQGGGSVA